MGVTLYVDDWHEQPCRTVRQFLASKYPAICEDCFAQQGYLCDEFGRHYEWVEVYDEPYPSAEFCWGSWSLVSQYLGLKTEFGVGDAEASNVPELVRECVRVVNTKRILDTLAYESLQRGNARVAGYSADRVKRCFELALGVLGFAALKKKGVYWG